MKSLSSVWVDHEEYISGATHRKHLQELCNTQLHALMPSKQAGTMARVFLKLIQKSAGGFEKKD